MIDLEKEIAKLNKQMATATAEIMKQADTLPEAEKVIVKKAAQQFGGAMGGSVEDVMKVFRKTMNELSKLKNDNGNG